MIISRHAFLILIQSCTKVNRESAFRKIYIYTHIHIYNNLIDSNPNIDVIFIALIFNVIICSEIIQISDVDLLILTFL